MSEDRYKVKTSGTMVSQAGLDPRLERVLTGLGLLSVPQLFSAMQAAPEAFRELLKDFNVSYEEMTKIVSEALSVEERQRLTNVSQTDYSMGHLGVPPPSTGRNVIRRNEK